MRMEVTVNGERLVVEVEPDTRLLDVLREQLGLVGTKEGCGRGECGACTVLVDGEPRMSCLELAWRSGAVETIEGMIEESESFRAALADLGGFQCGYCTPGQVVRAVALMRASSRVDDQQVRRSISGNVCRCTGYDAIVAAYRRVLSRAADAG